MNDEIIIKPTEYIDNIQEEIVSKPTEYIYDEEENATSISISVNSEFQLNEYYVPANSKCIESGQAKVFPCKSSLNDKEYIAKIYSSNGRKFQYIENINKIVKAINHPNMVKIYAEGKTKDQNHYMVVMEKYHELPKDFLCFDKSSKDADYLSKFTKALSDINDALTKLHDHNAFHGDIKPQNIMCYEKKGELKLVLIDFGNGAVDADKLNNNTSKGALLPGATRGYIAPEMFSGTFVNATEHTDNYSLGITFAEFLAGVYPSINDMIQSQRATDEQKKYYSIYKDSGHEIHSILLPGDIPECLLTLFKALLYEGTYDKTKNYRWGDMEVKHWIGLMNRGNYERAAKLPYGDQTKSHINNDAQINLRKESFLITLSAENDSPKTIKIDADDNSIAQAFLDNLDSIIFSIINDNNFIKCFEKVRPDIASMLEHTKELMIKNINSAENIFYQQVIKNIGSEKQQDILITKGFTYKNKKEFGEAIYKALHIVLEKNDSFNGSKIIIPSFKQIDEMKKLDEFSSLLLLFRDRYIYYFFEECNYSFTIDIQDMAILDKWCKRMNGNDCNKDKNGSKKEDLAELMIFAHHLTNKPSLITDGKAFLSYKSFTDYLNDLVNQKKIDKALSIKESCLNNNKMSIEFYAFCSTVKDLKSRPKRTSLI